jgi:hypothetical protein
MSDNTAGATTSNAIRGGSPSSAMSPETKQTQTLGQKTLFGVLHHDKIAEMTTQSQNPVLKGESQKLSPKSSQSLQDHLLVSSNSSMNMNASMNTTGQMQNGIFATPSVISQQFLKGQMGNKMQSNGNYQGNNSNLPTVDPGPFNPASGSGMDYNKHNNQFATLSQMLTQSNQMNTQSQVAQAAAILSASGFGSNVMNNQGPSTPDSTLAAAHAFVMMLNQQPVLGNQFQLQHHVKNDGNSHLNSRQQMMSLSSTLPRVPNVTQTSHKGDAESYDNKQQSSNVHESSKMYEASATSANVVEERKFPLETNRQPSEIKTSHNVGQQQKDTPYFSDNKSSSNNISSTLLNTLKQAGHHSKLSPMTHPQINQLSLRALQMPMANMQVPQVGPLQHASLKIAASRKGIIQPTVSPLVLSQMQGWSLNQLGK